MTAVAMPPSPRCGPSKTGARVVVGVDESPAGLAALRWAISFARERDAQLVAVRAWALGLPRHGGVRHLGNHTSVVLTFRSTQPAHAARKLTERVFGAVAGHVPEDIAVTIKTPEGNPGLVLAQIASGSDDLLVVGTRRGSSPRRAVHGSVSSQLMHHTHCPVVVVPSDG